MVKENYAKGKKEVTLPELRLLLRRVGCNSGDNKFLLLLPSFYLLPSHTPSLLVYCCSDEFRVLTLIELCLSSTSWGFNVKLQEARIEGSKCRESEGVFWAILYWIFFFSWVSMKGIKLVLKVYEWRENEWDWEGKICLICVKIWIKGWDWIGMRSWLHFVFV